MDLEHSRLPRMSHAHPGKAAAGRMASAALALGFLTVASAPCTASAQYPQQTIQLVVPYSPGGHTDLSARVIAEGLSKELDQSIVVENRPGATGSIGLQFVSRAKADGYVLGVAGSSNFVMLPLLRKTPPYDPQHDFSLLGIPMTVAFVMVVPEDSQFRSVQDVVAYGRANPDSLTYASSGIGGLHHMTTAYFNQLAGIQARNIPYKGGSENVSALLGGQVDFMFEAVSSILPHIQSGKVRALAVSSAERVPQLPDVPTVQETGTVQTFDVTAFSGLVGPAGLPAPVKERLAEAMRRAMEKPEIAEKLHQLGTAVVGLDEQGFQQRVDHDTNIWGELIKQVGIPEM